ncbi:Dual specificity protein phosphatase PHS1 [Platanthera guangdongensis]|uniref:Dual specificity protein phosphatase PHS1 n=1 Tax=Platanthera guangdongensis TaxID=2320717 RepID=A0ABR2LX79_9ASPA
MQAFDSQEAAGNTVVALGRILVLNLILRNEDRLPYHRLRWRGNPEILLFVDKIVSKKSNAFDEIVYPSFEKNNSIVDRSFQKIRKQTPQSDENLYLRALTSRKNYENNLVEPLARPSPYFLQEKM